MEDSVIMPNQYNSTNYLTGFLKKYKLIIIILILIPVVLSIACYFSVPFFNEAGSSAWLGFWGGYIGSTIMAGVTLYVLHTQLTQNHQENEENRHIQINTIKYQTKIAWINQLRKVITYSQENLTFSVQYIYEPRMAADKNSINQVTMELFENANKVKREFVTVLYGCGEYEDAFITFLDSFCKRYLCYLFDLEFLYCIEVSTTPNLLKKRVAEYQKREHTFIRKNKRLSAIIEERCYRTENEDLAYYANELIKRYEFEDFESKCLELLKYEFKIANDLLNGTKQDK